MTTTKAPGMTTTTTTAMEGLLHRYNHPASPALVAFESGDRRSDRYLIFITGLTGGLWDLPYLEGWSERLGAGGWSLVQPILSSSYAGYGGSSLADDTRELDQLIQYLLEQQRGKTQIALMGHSTGCQDVVWYLKHGRYRSLVRAAILQAPVSDRQYLMTGEQSGYAAAAASSLRLAEQWLRDGRGDEWMPRATDPNAPITAYRYHSLAARGTADDMFSTDLTDEEWAAVYAGIPPEVMMVALISGDDEYMPRPVVDKQLLLARLTALPPYMRHPTTTTTTTSYSRIVPGANHALDNVPLDAWTPPMLDFLRHAHSTTTTSDTKPS